MTQNIICHTSVNSLGFFFVFCLFMVVTIIFFFKYQKVKHVAYVDGYIR